MDEMIAEKVIPANDSVRLLDQMIEEMDTGALRRAYKRTGWKRMKRARLLLKILVYANMEGIYSSRAIESACKRDINFIWLLNGEQAPNHNEIARFRSERLPECGEELFCNLVKQLKELGELRYEHLFVDGTKIEANANKYSFVWRKSTTKYEARNDMKLKKAVQELSIKYCIPGTMASATANATANTTVDITAEELQIRLREQFAREDGEYVRGRGHRKSQLQRDIEQVEELLRKKAKYARYQETFRGRNSFSKTDPDATFMHMKEDHMQNAQLKPGYNLQLGVEGEYITGVSISSERSDQLCLIPLLEGMKEQLGEEYGDVTADAGYESEENYSYFEGSKTQCYIKPQNYERSKTKKYKNNMALRENMAYDEANDEYTCQNGKKLRAIYTGIQRSKSGFEREVTYYECESCEGCPHKKRCTRARGNRRMQVSKRFIRQRAESLERITSERGKLLRMNRSIQSEGAFGVVKQNYGFRQYLLRGNKKVLAETLLLAMAYDVNKLHAKIQKKRTGRQLFEKLLA